MPPRIALALAATLALTGAARAQELIVGASPMPVSPEAGPLERASNPDAQANGDWARKVMADAADGKPAEETARCVRNPDRQPHGEVWGSVGTGGYKSGGAIVTQPIGDCGTLTVGYEQVHGGDANRPRGRRR